MVLLIYFLKHIIWSLGLKMKNQLIQQEKVIKKNQMTYHHQKVMKKKLQKEKGIKILTPKKLLTRLPLLLAQIKAGNNS